ncbi:MAG: FAD-binding oxidoreductase [Chloroflexi bacterium]|nr:FAD-binding oxidoreductase [Chloroflexota bacterium]
MKVMNGTLSVETRAAFHNALIATVGPENVSDNEVVRATYAFDISPNDACMPEFVVKPKSVAQVQGVLKACNEYVVPVTPISAGVNVAGACIPSPGGIALDLRWMDSILEINTEAAYALVEPGVTFDKLTSALHKVGFRSQIPTAPGGASVMGNALMVSGELPGRHMDPILALEAVLATGEIVRTGSAAVPGGSWNSPNGPYAGLTHLFCCSGTMGVVTKIAVRIYPIFEDRRVVVAGFDDFGAALPFANEVLRADLCDSCIVWSYPLYKTYDITVKRDWTVEVPPELAGDARDVPGDLPRNIVTIHMSGYHDDMEGHQKTIELLLAKFGGRLMEREAWEDRIPGLFRATTQFYTEYHQPKMEHNKKYGFGKYIPWIIPSQVSRVVEIEKMALDKLSSDLAARPVCYYVKANDRGRSWVFRIYSFFDPDDRKLHAQVRQTYAEMFKWVMDKYGVAPSRHRRGQGSALERLGGYGVLLKKIKEAVDPNNIMNPGAGIF